MFERFFVYFPPPPRHFKTGSSLYEHGAHARIAATAHTNDAGAGVWRSTSHSKPSHPVSDLPSLPARQCFSSREGPSLDCRAPNPCTGAGENKWSRCESSVSRLSSCLLSLMYKGPGSAGHEIKHHLVMGLKWPFFSPFLFSAAYLFHRCVSLLSSRFPLTCRMFAVCLSRTLESYRQQEVHLQIRRKLKWCCGGGEGCGT